ncbi:MAG: hypothetical protein E2577_11145, partial [Starkeya sp.]|nr:hypothetical protein [Starkeya sp.]
MATVSGLFDNYDDALTAVNKLQALGIDRAQISLVANNSDDWYGRDSATTTTTTTVTDSGNETTTTAAINDSLTQDSHDWSTVDTTVDVDANV